MIAVDRLTKSYGAKEVLRGVTFRAEPGAITLLVGPNGAGKSTTLKVLAGLNRPSSGLVQVNGVDVVADRIKAQSRLAYLPQSPSFHPRLNCLEVLRFYARLRRVPTARCEAMLELTGLTDVARIQTGKLSGGTRQRLGLALLLLPDAPTLLLDEPGLSLDPAWRKRLQETLHFEAERGKTVLITTHLIAEWNNVANRCLLCRDGAIERELDPTDLLQNFDGAVSPPGSACASHAGEGVVAFTHFSSPRFKACWGEAQQPAGEGARASRSLR
jgi:heme ABC exporter ATP-binding subunit CcmA